jgi:hypothetical protein
MDPRMMNQWLAAQSQKKQVTEASMQRKRLGIKEGVNYGDINFRVPVDPNTGKPYFGDLAQTTTYKQPRSPESAANLTRRLGNLYNEIGNTENINRQERIARMMMAKGVAPEGTGTIDASKFPNFTNTASKLIQTIKDGEPVGAGQLSPNTREFADERQVAMSRNARESRVAAKLAAANRIGGARFGAVSTDMLGGLANAVGLGIPAGQMLNYYVTNPYLNKNYPTGGSYTIKDGKTYDSQGNVVDLPPYNK